MARAPIQTAAQAGAATAKTTAGTTETGTSVAISQKALDAMALFDSGKFVFGDVSFEVVKSVTKPTLKQEDFVPIAVRIMSPIYQGGDLNAKAAKRGKGKVTEMAPAELVDVLDLLDHNAEKVMIANEVLSSTLQEQYPNHSYVGRFFGIMRAPAGNGKRYKDYRIKEMQPKGGDWAPVTPPPVVDNETGEIK